jgi:hypothetical protein
MSQAREIVSALVKNIDNDELFHDLLGELAETAQSKEKSFHDEILQAFRVGTLFITLDCPRITRRTS